MPFFRHPHLVTTLFWATALAVGMGPIANAPARAQTPPVSAPAAKPAKSATAGAAAKPGKTEPGPSGPGDSALKQRIENLEEQLTDMQVVVGTLESFAKSNGAASASPTYRAGGALAEPAPGAGVDQARISGLEAQVRSLTTQVQQLSEQLRTQNGYARNTQSAVSTPAGAAASPASAPSSFGTATVAPAKADQIGGLLNGQGSPSEIAAAPLPAAAAPAGDGDNPKQLYETAYGYLLQQDYGAAEVAFDDFLKRFPTDALAGNAQFWLGESYFVRAQYKPAAGAFLKGYQTYGRNSKAPDSLLKLAMSLGRMGQKDAACSSFGELATRFPAASADVKSRAVVEKQRVGCP